MALKRRGLWGTFAFGAALVALLVRLGLWQLDRAQEKRLLYAQYTAVAHASALRVETTSSAELTKQLWRPVTVTGQYLPKSLLLVTIIVTLGSAFVSLFRSKGSGTGTVKALTLRVGLSITLFIVLMVLAALGIIKPH